MLAAKINQTEKQTRIYSGFENYVSAKLTCCARPVWISVGGA